MAGVEAEGLEKEMILCAFGALIQWALSVGPCPRTSVKQVSVSAEMWKAVEVLDTESICSVGSSHWCIPFN